MRALLLLFALALPLAAADKPNVLFIAVDDLNDWIGALGGHPQAQTPNIDRLIERGVLFTHAYTAAPACNPSRAALMTGIAPHRSGVYLNSQPWRPVMPDAVTIPQHFRKFGYTARASGKILHGRYPDPPSWDEYWPSQTNNRPEDPVPAERPVNGIPDTAHFDWGPVAEDPEAMGDFQVASWISEQLGKAHDKPFFLACGIFRPHLPWYVPQRYFDAFPLESIELPAFVKDDLEDVPPAGVRMANPGKDHANVTKHGEWKAAVQGYLASILFADEQVGRVLDALEASPHRDDTIVVLWTDHGWHLGEKEHWRKFALWEEATRTPLVWVAPEGTPGLPEGTVAGRRVDTPVNLLDVYPTLIELAGIGPNEELSGRSLVPLMRDPEAEWERPSLTTHGRLNHALRSPNFRYIRYADGAEELYDHRNDPLEAENLAGDEAYADVIARLKAWLPDENEPDAPRDR